MAFKFSYLDKINAEDEKNKAKEQSVSEIVNQTRKKIKKEQSGEFENTLEEKVSKAKPKRKPSKREASLRVKASLDALERTKKLREEMGLSKKGAYDKHIDRQWEDTLEDATEELEAGKETDSALTEMRAVEKEKIAEQDKKMAKVKPRKNADIDDKFDFSDTKEEKFEEVSDTNIIESVSLEEEEKNRDLAKHLKSGLNAYPELLTPEIKKNLQVIAKQEDIVEQNKGNAKKGEQEKFKKAKEVIKRAQAAVDDYIHDLIKQYNTSQELLIETSQALYGQQVPGKQKASGGLERKLLNIAGDKAGLDKKGLFGGIKNFFSDRKLKRELGDKWDEFEVMRGEYQDKVKFYNQRMASHSKRFGHLESDLESGVTFQLAQRGGDISRGRLA